MHQEDACQALSIVTHVPAAKYEKHGGPNLVAIAGLLDQWSDPRSLADLVAQVAFNVLVGNADCHGKNVSFVLDPVGGVQLSPVYDVMSTAFYQGQNGTQRVSTDLGMRVDTKHDVNDVTMSDVAREAARWRMRAARIDPVIEGLLDRFPAALEMAAAEVDGVSEPLLELLAARTDRARAGWLTR